MSNLKHTKGPWTYSKTGQHWNNPDVINIEINYGADGECIADTVYEEADARLIASAPEMLNKLIDLYKNITSIRPILKSVIEKATGMSIDEVLND